MKYKRVLLKLSGEALSGKKEFGIDNDALRYFVSEIKSIVDRGVETAIVVGGGNLFRGSDLLSNHTVGKLRGDYMGMLATVINGIALHTAIEKSGMNCRLVTSFAIEKIGEVYNQDNVLSYLDDGNVVIFTGGTGNPFFTTDTAATLRAVEIGANLLLKGTRVDGIYSDDPEKNPQATKFDDITFDEVYQKNLKVMDLTSITLCKENDLPLVVFNINTKGNLQKIISGEKTGTFVRLNKNQ
jgi:uridylate kinase